MGYSSVESHTDGGEWNRASRPWLLRQDGTDGENDHSHEHELIHRLLE